MRPERLGLRYRWAGAALIAGLVLGFSAPVRPQESAAGARSETRPRVVTLRIEGAILPLPAEYVIGGIDEAIRTQASLVLITMNTPGGLDSSMREIIQRILTSPVPVAVYISPEGSRGASAGFYILLAADIAAMAPGTHTGTASPVLVNILTRSSVPLDDTMQKKILNDATTYLRSYASKRGRNVEEAEKAITEARGFTETESVKRNLIDLVAKSPDDLLTRLDGREIGRFDGSRARLSLKSPILVPIEMTTRQRWLARIASPDILFILFILALLGIYIEFTHPGLILPGVVGGVSLVLALVAMRVLPINAVGLMLILLAIVLFVLEAKYTSYGLLGLGGAVCMVLGALLLVRSPITGMGVSPSVAIGVTLPFALISIFLMNLVLRSYRWKVASGVEQMVGATGQVRKPIPAGGQGMVFFQSELWRATAPVAIPEGAQVRVVRVDGLTLHVEPAELPSASKSAGDRAAGPSAG